MATFDTVSHLGVEYGMSFYERALAQADEGQMIHTALEAYGLTANPDIHRLTVHAFKTYPGAVNLSLPQVVASDSPPFEQVVVNRRSQRRFTGQPIALTHLAKLLYLACGITGALDASAHAIVQPVRAAPSGGALYPVELYAAISQAETIEPGLYHYAVATHSLERLQTGSVASLLAKATSDTPTFTHACLTLVLTLMPARTRFKYGERSYRFALLEAGHIAQNILLTATALGLGATPIAGFVDDEINALLDVDGVSETSIYLIPIGHIAPPPKAPSVEATLHSLFELLWTSQPPGA